MLPQIVQHSEALISFVFALQLSLYQPQIRHLLQIVDALLVCNQRKTLSDLSRFLHQAPDPKVLADFFRESPWESRPAMIHLQGLGEADAVVIMDGSGFPKQGKHSIGVAPQYCGHLGKIANCQQGVFLAYASRAGYSFLDERLYLSQEWFAADHRQRCIVYPHRHPGLFPYIVPRA